MSAVSRNGWRIADRRGTRGAGARRRRVRAPHLESLEDRTLLAALQIAGQLEELSALDSNVPTPNDLSVATPGSQQFSHNDGTAVSNVTLTAGASTTGNPGINLDVLSQGSVAKHGTASVSVAAGLAGASGNIGPTVSVPVTIVATDSSEQMGDPVDVDFNFAFDVKSFAANNATANLLYSVSYTYQGTTTLLASNDYPLSGSDVTPAGPGPMDNKTGILHAHIGDTFTLSFSENFTGQTIPPYLGGLVNNVGWLIDANLDASVTGSSTITPVTPTLSDQTSDFLRVRFFLGR